MTLALPSFVEKYSKAIPNAGDHSTDVVSLAGRIHNIRVAGTKLRFYDLVSEGQRCQVMATASESESPADFEALHDIFRRGDIVGVTGKPMRTKKGELSVSPSTFVLLSPNLHQLPHGLKDQETRHRKRYLDLIVNQDRREVFVKRARIVNYIRRFLDNLGFLEVRSASYLIYSPYP